MIKTGNKVAVAIMSGGDAARANRSDTLSDNEKGNVHYRSCNSISW